MKKNTPPETPTRRTEITVERRSLSIIRSFSDFDRPVICSNCGGEIAQSPFTAEQRVLSDDKDQRINDDEEVNDI